MLARHVKTHRPLLREAAGQLFFGIIEALSVSIDPTDNGSVDFPAIASELRADIVAAVPHLRRYAHALLSAGGPLEADDLVQSAVERALLRIETLRPKSNVRVWMFTILHNIYVDRVRRQRRESEALSRLKDVSAKSVPGRATMSLQINELSAALANLPWEQKEVVLLVGLEGLPYIEAAEVLGIPVGTVRSRLSRGREALRAMLGAEGDQEARSC